ncbi:DMT family transporter [Candidatus Thorarchaeota archaeon]|nr:MAG: DMT family transporter [Candidatus Thorarchaeota archaeon]
MQSAELILGSAIGLFTAMLWGISTNVYQSQRDEATPIAISAIKMWTAMAAMTLIVLLPFRSAPFFVPLESAVFLVASVTIGLVIGDLAYLISQERIGVSYAFPISNTFPILTYMIAIIFVGEVIIVSRIIGVVVAVAGVILLSRSQSLVEAPRNCVVSEEFEDSTETCTDWLGIGMALLAALCWATGSVLLQRGVEGIDPIDANFVRMVFGSALFVPIVSISLRRGMPRPTGRAARIVLVAGLFGMTIGSLLYTYSVKLVGAAIAALMGSTSPLFALPISILALKEGFSSKSILGAVLTVTGVILVIIAV